MAEDSRICFIVNEYPVRGKVGGYGVLTKDLSEGLKAKGWDVCVVFPRYPKIAENIKKNLEFVNGIPVLTVPTTLSGKLKWRNVYKLVDADIFHNQDIIQDSWVAMKYGPKNAKHLITFQDPPTFKDIWMLEKIRTGGGTLKKIKWKTKFALRHKLLSSVVENADGLYSEARFLIDKAKTMYKIKQEIGYLPNPVRVPSRSILKSSQPTVCFLGRWDAQKRPWLFFELARKYPKVKFIAMGQTQENPEWLEDFVKKYGKLKNLEMVGFVPEEEKRRILAKSWALVSTSIREGLPVAFLESLAHKTPIISYVNPDQLPEKFGFWAKDENFEDGMDWLLNSNDWRKKGKEGRTYIDKWHAYDTVIKMHEKVYNSL